MNFHLQSQEISNGSTQIDSRAFRFPRKIAMSEIDFHLGSQFGRLCAHEARA